MKQDRNAIKDHIDQATEYLVLANVETEDAEKAPQSHMYINGRADRLVDLIAMIFDRHPNLFGLLLERHQPEFLQDLAKFAAQATCGEPEVVEEDESTAGDAPASDESPETDVTNANTLEEMRSLWTDIGLQIKEGGKQ